MLRQEATRRPLDPSPHLFLPPYHALAYGGRFGPAFLRELAAVYAARAATVTGAAAEWGGWTAPAAPAAARRAVTAAVTAAVTRADRRLVVGYLSTDFGEHPTSHLMRNVWALQRARGRVRAICFSRSNDRSEQRKYIAETCDEFVDLTGYSWRRAADEINARRVAILIDLNGHCGQPQFEILSLRPAPLQMTYMGHPGTSVARYIQYALADRATAPPRSRSHFAEHLLVMPQWHVTDYRFSHAFVDRVGAPPQGAPPTGPKAVWPGGASADGVGLPWGRVVLATFNQLYKVGAPNLLSWVNALRRAPKGVLWILQFPAAAAANLQLEAAAAGLRGARVLSAPTAERRFHLARSHLAQLFLDTGPYSGHTTTGDALWMGTPVVTVPGDMMQSRVAASYSANTGCAQPVVRSLRHYEAFTASLAQRPPALASLRACLARSRWTSAAFDTANWVDKFDSGAHMIWEIYRNGLQPMHLLLPSRQLAAF